MKKTLFTLLSAMALLPAMASNNVAPWGWATCSDEAGTAFTLSGGCFTDAKTATLTALGGGQTDDKQIKQAIALNDIIILDGSNGDFTIEETIKITAMSKTIIGINNARLCTKFYLTDADNAYLKEQNLEGLSSTDQYTGTLPDGTTLTCDKRAFFTKKAMMELQYQKTGVYSLPNKAGIFIIESSGDNIIIRNLSFIGPGAVDIDGADLITNQGTHVWIDHCTFQDSQDGALDSKRCDWSTYTYNHFYYTSRSYSHAYTCGCGWADGTMILHLTFASNMWGEGCMRRLPQCGDCYVHLVNNYHNCPGNSTGMTINDNCKALVENNFAAAGVNNALTGGGSGRNITVRGNNFNYSNLGSEVTVPYQYTKIAAADVPANLTGTEGAGATLGNDATAILSTIPTVSRGETGEEIVYYINATTTDAEKDDQTYTFVSNGKSFTMTNSGNKGYGAGTTASQTFKLSNNVLYTLSLPEGVSIKAIKAIGYTNEDGNTGYIKEINGVAYDETAGTFPARNRDGDSKNPPINEVSFNLSSPATGSLSIKTFKQLALKFELTSGSTTGISNVKANSLQDGATYTLQGVRVSNPQKCIYIQNGKKVVIK